MNGTQAVQRENATQAAIGTRESRAHAMARSGDMEGAIRILMDPQDKIQLAMDAMLGVRAALNNPDVRPFRGIKEAYVQITGDELINLGRKAIRVGDKIESVEGSLWKVSASVAAADLPNVLLNSLNKRLVQDYFDIGWGGLDRIVRFTSRNDFRTQHTVRLGYFPDIATVSEGAAYAEIANPADQLISYAILKKGNAFTLTEEIIRNDDTNFIVKIPERLARAGIRTVKKFVSSLLTSPGNYDVDGVAIFHASHNNLGSVALSAAELDAREALLFAQTEPDSAAKLGLRLHWIVIPINLDSTARAINNNPSASPNWYGRFGTPGSAMPPGIIVNELLTDANDWYYGTDDAPFIEVGVLDGIEGQPPIPKIVLANAPTRDKAFTEDRAVYKVKLAFGGDYVDFRSAGKNVVP